MTLHIHINGMICSIFLLSSLAFADDKTLGKAKSAVCSACHGVNGISSNPLRPNLAGQDANYMVGQLKAFRSGSRKNDIMMGIAESLTDIEMVALAAFYSTQAPEIMSGDTLLIEKGKDKYSLCWGCHGENGEGPGSYPRISGQHSQYTVQQLKNFKNGLRINPAMKAIIADLSSDDMEALGAYIATLNLR